MTNVDDREGFVFLCDLDPFFLLRFVGEGSMLVAAHDIQDDGRHFSLNKYRGSEQRSIDDQIDRQPNRRDTPSRRP